MASAQCFRPSPKQQTGILAPPSSAAHAAASPAPAHAHNPHASPPHHVEATPPSLRSLHLTQLPPYPPSSPGKLLTSDQALPSLGLLAGSPRLCPPHLGIDSSALSMHALYDALSMSAMPAPASAGPHHQHLHEQQQQHPHPHPQPAGDCDPQHQQHGVDSADADAALWGDSGYAFPGRLEEDELAFLVQQTCSIQEAAPQMSYIS